MKILQINFYDLFSTGNIMLNIARVARERGHDVRTASKYMRMSVIRKSNNPHHFYIGNRVTNTIHRYFSWITDLQDCASIFPTLRLIYKIGRIKPDIIHLHDIVGWYLNIGVLFHYLKKKNISIVWTFHDCWTHEPVDRDIKPGKKVVDADRPERVPEIFGQVESEDQSQPPRHVAKSGEQKTDCQ